MSEESEKLKGLAKKTSPIDKQTFLSYLMGMNVKYWSDASEFEGYPDIENPLLFNPRTAKRGGKSRYSAARIRNGYHHFALVDTAEPAKVINRLNKTQHTEEFLKIPSPLISILRHYVRLYEIVGGDGHKDKYLVPVPFPTNAYGSVRAKTAEGGTRITVAGSNFGAAQLGTPGDMPSDYGLQEISLDFQATNPAEINNNIVCKIKIFFNSVRGLTSYQVLDVPRTMNGVGGFDPDAWNFMRLVTRGPESSAKAKLVIGFDPVSLSAMEAHLPDYKINKLQNFLLHETLSLTLSLKEHEIDVNENGSVVLTITYHGGIASELSNSSRSNIFSHHIAEDSGGRKDGDFLKYIDQRLAELGSLKNSKNREKGVGPSSVQPPDPNKQKPDYSREYLEEYGYRGVREKSLFTGEPRSGTASDIREWLDEDPALTEERSLLRRRNEILFKEQQRLGVAFFDYLINEDLIRNLYVPIQTFKKSIQAASLGPNETKKDFCDDFRRLLPFVSLQANQAGPHGYIGDPKYKSPIDDPNRTTNKFTRDKPVKIDNILINPPKEVEGELVEKLMRTTFDYGRSGKNKALQELSADTNEISKNLFSVEDGFEIKDGEYAGRAAKDLKAALKIARSGKEASGQKDLLKIQYVFLGDIIEGILAYHAIGQQVEVDNGNDTFSGGFFHLDMQKHLILNNFELNDIGQCPDKPTRTTAYWKNLNNHDGGMGGRLTEAEKKGAGAQQTTVQRAKVRNIADIPIALETLSSWWIANVVKKLRTTWSIGDFLNSVMTQLIPAGIGLNGTPNSYGIKPSRAQVPSLNIFEGDLNARSIFDATFTANRRNRSTFDRDIGDENYFASVLEAGRKRLDDDQSLSNIITDRDLEAIQKAPTPSPYKPFKREPQGHWESKGITDDAVTFMIMSVLPLQRFDLAGNESSDRGAGVWHFRLARDGGPVLSYAFSRSEIPYLSEANVFQSSRATLNDTSSGISYNINLKMIGNQILQPGSTMFVDLLGLGFGSSTNKNSIAYGLNIGGYYVVKSVKSNFGIEGYFTEVDAVWQKTMINMEEDE